MLHNDVARNDRMDTVHARDLQNAVIRHHQNNPHASMEAAFEYIMLNSSTFRALPSACIGKARRYLALPNQEDDAKAEFKKASSEKLGDIFSGLNEALQELADSGQPLFITPLGLPDSEGATPIGWKHIILDNSADTLETPSEPKQGTTVVHAERVVVDNKKMIKILKFENVAYMKDLPDGYLSEAPTFYKCDPPRNIKANVMFHEQIDSSNTLSYSISHGNTISIKEFGKMIKTMKEAGARLAKINKTAKLEKEHSGKFTVSV